jgi:pyrroline-5-carboxylate reductase
MNGTLTLPGPTWFVGCGNMGRAILEGWRSGGLDLSAVTVIRPSATPVEGVRVVSAFDEAGPQPKLALLAFKPQKLEEVARRLSSFIGP